MRVIETVQVDAGTTEHIHVCDGEEVVMGGDDGQVWLGTFADPNVAAGFVVALKRRAGLVKLGGQRVREVAGVDVRA